VGQLAMRRLILDPISYCSLARGQGFWDLQPTKRLGLIQATQNNNSIKRSNYSTGHKTFIVQIGSFVETPNKATLKKSKTV
jgi:hypothetical protein